MAKILSFQNKEGASSGQDFLSHENETLSFRTTEDGAVSLGNISPTSLPSPLPDPRKNWSNQELADLFRVRHLLVGAGIPVDTLCGSTDEGDPWFVYCHLNGDVFIHMARIDGMYVLDSPNLHRPLRGADFNALIADFTSDALPTRAAAGNRSNNKTEQRVIKLERGNKVRLHPSAMLAALIWTLFLASEELVMLVPEDQAAESDDLLDFENIVSADLGHHQILAMETADLNSLSIPSATKDVHEDGMQISTDLYGQIRETMGQQGLAMQQNTYAIGLSTIAIAMGFMSEMVLHDNQSKVLEGLKSLGLAKYGADTETGSEQNKTADADNDELLEMLNNFLGIDLSLDAETAEARIEKDGSTLLQQDVQHLVEAVDETPLLSPKSVQALRENKDMDPSEDPAVASGTQEMLVAAKLAIKEQDANPPALSDVLKNQHNMEEFQLGQTTVLASFDINKTDLFSLSDYLFFAQSSTNHEIFDAHAQSFIDFIQAKDTDVGLVAIGNEIVMIDYAAFQDKNAETYTFSWETYDGQIISMIGLKEEFQHFDLIA